MLQVWSHTRTLKAFRVTATFRSRMSESTGETKAADRKWYTVSWGLNTVCVRCVILTGLGRRRPLLGLWWDVFLWGRRTARRQRCGQEVYGRQEGLGVEHDIQGCEGHLQRPDTDEKHSSQVLQVRESALNHKHLQDGADGQKLTLIICSVFL